MNQSNEKQKVLSDIYRDIGQVLFASVLIDPITRGEVNYYFLAFGLAFTLVFWYFSIKINHD
ncbi:MAG: hypothetical protein WCV73_01175 [Patescibacteria group bacterium]|jgi:hypothetical protein